MILSKPPGMSDLNANFGVGRNVGSRPTDGDLLT